MQPKNVHYQYLIEEKLHKQQSRVTEDHAKVVSSGNLPPPSLILASLRAHRNILFGATSTVSLLPLATVAAPLVKAALSDAGHNGEQPQALATLHGLCEWVKQKLITMDDSHHHNDDNNLWNDMTDVEREAVKAIATGIPRLGHSVVGAGTYQDGAAAWRHLGRQFVLQQPTAECQLYQAHGGQLVDIEALADTQPAYLASAGGAMARFFFL